MPLEFVRSTFPWALATNVRLHDGAFAYTIGIQAEALVEGDRVTAARGRCRRT